MAIAINVHAIFDVARVSSNIITFMRYQVEPQGDRAYQRDMGGGTQQIFHEICLQKNTADTIPAYVVGNNYYSIFANGDVYHDWVANLSQYNIPFIHNNLPSLAKKVFDGATSPLVLFNPPEQHFTLRLMGTRTSQPKADSLGVTRGQAQAMWSGSFYTYLKPNRNSSWKDIGVTQIGYINNGYGGNGGKQLIDISAYRAGAGGPLIWSFNNTFLGTGSGYNGYGRSKEEWSSRYMERWRMVQIITPSLTI
jgi:hypothetical protein